MIVRAVRMALLALAVFAPSVAAAQVTIKVVAEDGRPLSGVEVELWSGVRRVAMRSTGADGKFIVAAVGDSVREAWTVTVRRMGYRPVSARMPREATSLVVTLAALPPLLREVTVVTKPDQQRDPCTRRPSVEAMVLYARAASFYRDDTRWLDRIARYAYVIRSTQLAERDSMRGVPQRGGWIRNAGVYDGPSAGNTTAVPRRLSVTERLALPFPTPERQRAAGWSFPLFHQWQAPSFVSRSFVDSMPKAVVMRGGKRSVISFCPRDRRPPYTSGEIELGTDSTIVAVRWKFVLGKPGQEAGGLAVFPAPESRTTRAHLLPANAMFWSRVPMSERFETTEYAYGRWFVAEPGETIRAVPPGSVP
jgi:hypothetical protein